MIYAVRSYPLLWLIAALPWNALAGDCTVGGKISSTTTFQDTPAIACPNGACPVDALDTIASQAVQNGCDPPLSLCSGMGTASRPDTGTTTPSGYCAPGTNSLRGAPSCPTYNVNGNQSAIPNNGAGASIYGAGGTGNMNPIPALQGLLAQLIQTALNQPPQPTNTLASIPPLTCGGALSLANQATTCGGITIGVSPNYTALQGAANVINDLLPPGSPGNSGTCAGSTINTAANEPSLIIPPTTGNTPINNNQVTPPDGSIVYIPGDIPVTLNLNTGGAVTFPSGATFLDANGDTISIPEGGTVTAGGGTVILPAGSTVNGVAQTGSFTEVYQLNQPPITTNGLLSINTNSISASGCTQLNVDPGGQLTTPQV